MEGELGAPAPARRRAPGARARRRARRARPRRHRGDGRPPHAGRRGDDRRRAGRPAGGGRDRALDDLAAVLAALRRVPPDAAGVRLRPHQGFGHPSQRELHHRLLGAADAARVEALWRAFEAEPQDAPVLAHADLKPEHVLHDPRSGRLTGVLDWGDACLSHPGLRPRGRRAVLRRDAPRRPRRAAVPPPTPRRVAADAGLLVAVRWLCDLDLAVARRRRAVRRPVRRAATGAPGRPGLSPARTSGGARRRRRSSRRRWCGSGAPGASSRAPATPPPPTAGERRQQALRALAAALRARDGIVRAPYELLEALGAGFAAVLVDRHGRSVPRAPPRGGSNRDTAGRPSINNEARPPARVIRNENWTYVRFQTYARPLPSRVSSERDLAQRCCRTAGEEGRGTPWAGAART